MGSQKNSKIDFIFTGALSNKKAMNIQNLKGHIPEKVLSEIQSVIEKFQINTPFRLAHFLCQCFHESNKFTATVENLNYSEERLLKVFKKYFNTSNVKAYARNPEKIANLVYANRMGNGNEQSGDGWKHKGVGYIQTTGKNNQQAFFKSIGKDINTNPKEIADKYPLLSAAYFFYSNGLNSIADRGASEDVVIEITKKVNGGTNGLDERIKYFNKFYNLLK